MTVSYVIFNYEMDHSQSRPCHDSPIRKDSAIACVNILPTGTIPAGISGRRFHLQKFALIVTAFVVLFPHIVYSQPSDEFVLRQGLAIKSVGRYGRSPVHEDAIEAQVISRSWIPPTAGDKIVLPDGSEQTWEPLSANKDGQFEGPALQGGYAYFMHESPGERVMILEAAGHNMVYVNGEPRTGDPYEYGYVRLPILFHAGKNHLLFHVGRGRLRAKITAPKSSVILNTGDSTLPDLKPGDAGPYFASTVVINASTAPVDGLDLVISRGDTAPIVAAIPRIPPLSTRKVPFSLGATALDGAASAEFQLEVVRRKGMSVQRLDSARLSLRVRKPGQTYKRTFISDIDGSVQYYAVYPEVSRAEPAAGQEVTERRPALFLTLHGASVEAIGQADAYSPKSWGNIVAPTNRRPYGFDWEDWGRTDAMEVLDYAIKELNPDPTRIYLTGHSMGGHGTWQVGATYPDRFAAIGPSAGWISFNSYAGGKRFENPTPVQEMLNRASNPSNTLALSRNYLQHGIYILHGDADDNVPPREARDMAKHLSEFHHDFVFYEQKGAGHWWDVSDEPGADCVDWAPMFDLFARHRLPSEEEVRQVEFVTENPEISAKCHWATIEQQIHPLMFSSINIRFDPAKRRFAGKTVNVSRLALSVKHIQGDGTLIIELDGQKLENVELPEAAPLFLTNEDGKWTVAGSLPAALKGPHRNGPFKQAFNHNFLLVYGTKGTPEENAWAFAKARYDAETWWYRGNGSVDVVADTAFKPGADAWRSVILYGNADTSSVWKSLLPDCPVQVHRGFVRIGERQESGLDLACTFLRPRPGGDGTCVGVVSGSGIFGMRLTDRLPYFVSGVAYPDMTLIGPEMLSSSSTGARAAGFFGNDWSVKNGEIAWRDQK
jgi:dienelactone hydrolase